MRSMDTIPSVPSALDYCALPSEKDACKRMGIPVEYKLLAVLRILGWALHFDDVTEYTDTGFRGEAVRTFFHDITSVCHCLLQRMDQAPRDS